MTQRLPDPRDPETRSDDWPISERARELSKMLEPSHAWWSVPAWFVWRFRQQPRHIEAQIRRSMTGKHEPIERFGSISPE